MKSRYSTGKKVVKTSGILFVSAFVVAIITENIDLSTYMILVSWLMFIIGGCMIGFSPEEKKHVEQKRAARKRKYEQYLKEAESREKSKPKKETTYSKGPNMWVLSGLGALIAFPFAVILGMAKKYD